MTDGLPDDLPPEFLAAYADGELGPRDRRRVEQWLAEHPEARELLDDQESLGPRNVEFWNAVRPPEPSRGQWETVVHAVRGRGPASRPRRWLPWVGSLALAATATAATAFFALPSANGPVPLADPEHSIVAPVPADADDEPFAMAGPDDVRIVSLPEAAAHLLVVGQHPLRDSMIVLARADEVEFFGIGTDPSGRFPEVPTEVAPDDAPMIWAPKDP
jgi:anti-sigma factor RsiW